MNLLQAIYGGSGSHLVPVLILGCPGFPMHDILGTVCACAALASKPVGPALEHCLRSQLYSIVPALGSTACSPCSVVLGLCSGPLLAFLSPCRLPSGALLGVALRCACSREHCFAVPEPSGALLGVALVVPALGSTACSPRAPLRGTAWSCAVVLAPPPLPRLPPRLACSWWHTRSRQNSSDPASMRSLAKMPTR